jgi:hypothetical protein
VRLAAELGTGNSAPPSGGCYTRLQ